jgi:hypothetical protein
MSAIDSLSFLCRWNSIRAFCDTVTVLGLLTPKTALIQPRLLTPAASHRRETNRQACFISPSSERPIVRRFDTRGKTRAGFMAPPAQRQILSGQHRGSRSSMSQTLIFGADEYRRHAMRRGLVIEKRNQNLTIGSEFNRSKISKGIQSFLQSRNTLV